MSTVDKCKKELRRLMKEVESNRYCADCGGSPAPWASTNLGVFLCVGCSGIHRSLGVHISFVKSATLDDWNAKLLQRFKQQGGNAAVNRKYEAKLKSTQRIDPSFHTDPSRKIEIVKFIRNKYEKRLWYKAITEKKKKRSKTKAVKPAKAAKFTLNSRSPSQSPTDSASVSLSPSPNLKVVKRESLLSDDDLDEFHRDFNDPNVSKEPKKVQQFADILDLIQEVPSEKAPNQVMYTRNYEPQQTKKRNSAKSILSKYHNHNHNMANGNMNGYGYQNQYQYQAQPYGNNNNNQNYTQNAMQNYPQPPYQPSYVEHSPIATNSANYYAANNSNMFNHYNNNNNMSRKMTW